MILKNRSSAISITDEDIRELTAASRSPTPLATTRMRSSTAGRGSRSLTRCRSLTGVATAAAAFRGPSYPT